MSANAQDLPLKGLEVLELHAIGPVPFAGMVLRSLGAHVVRVSPPTDPALGVAIRREHDLLNAGKEQIYADMKSADGMKVVHERLAKADVLLEGFRPGVLERLGLAPADVLAKYPRVVIGRLSGWATAAGSPIAPATTSTTWRSPASCTRWVPPRSRCRRSTSSATSAAARCTCCWGCSPSSCSVASAAAAAWPRPASSRAASGCRRSSTG